MQSLWSNAYGAARRAARVADEFARLTHIVDVAENDAGATLGETHGNGLADATGRQAHAMTGRPWSSAWER